jgi:hypothetical protein
LINKSIIINFINKMTTKKIHKCDICNKTFTRSTGLNDHLKTLTHDKIFKSLSSPVKEQSPVEEVPKVPEYKKRIRKKKTIDDFVISFDNTTETDTTRRLKIRKISSTIIIDFSNLDTKHYRNLNIHTINDEDMWLFLKLLNTILKNPIDLSFVKIKKRNSKGTISDDWYDMPAFHNNQYVSNCGAVLLMIEVIDKKSYLNFIKLFNTTFDCILWPKKKTFWYPERSELLTQREGKMYTSLNNYQPRYPIYIISKGRYEKRYTSKYLEWINVDYKIVIQPEEFPLYNKYIDAKKIITLPECYLNLNQGGIPARNFVWWHAKESGAERHWILDDNITSWRRYHENEKSYVKSGLVFCVVEDYVDRYKNIKMAGHNYSMFGVSLNTHMQPVTLNTRIYSSILLSNDIFPHFTWRGKYNEDTDLSLRILKNGYPTVLFNCILADKLTTLTQKGGNTDTIYAEDNGLSKKANSLQKQHPDVATVVEKFGRVHHQVNYSKFKNLTLQYKDDVVTNKNINEYGMILVDKNVEDLYTK